MWARAFAVRVAGAAAEQALDDLAATRSHYGEMTDAEWEREMEKFYERVRSIREGVLRLVCEQEGESYEEALRMAGWGWADMRDELQPHPVGALRVVLVQQPPEEVE